VWKLTLIRSVHDVQKKIGSSAFARYPTGTIMHYICYTNVVASQVPGQSGIPAERGQRDLSGDDL